MIIVRLVGGLGNQMFEYAFGRRLAYENNLPLKLDPVFGFQGDPYQRQYALGCFAIQEDFVQREQVPFYIKHGRVVRRLGFVLQSLLPRSMRSLIRERQECVFDPDVLRVTRPVYVFGYWQCAQYYEPIADVIRNEFTFKQPLSECAQLLARNLQRDGTVSIHIRRLHGVAMGKSIPSAVNTHGACPLEYYQDAVEIVAERIKQPMCFVFSDDPVWCKEQFRLSYPVCFVSDRGLYSDVEELQLMSMCQHHIISNSSFSWWGAWLGKKPDEIVVAPARWFRGSTSQPRDLFPSSWIVI